MPLAKIIICIFIINIFAYANGKDSLITAAYIATDKGNYKNYKQYDLKNDYFKKFNVKLEINKKALKDKTYYFFITTEVKSLISSNVAYNKSLDKIIVKLDRNTPSNIYFSYENKQEQPLNFKILIFSEFEYQYMLENKSILYGIAYGIIFSAFLYNLVIFLNTRKKAFLYYSLMQIFLLIILVDLVRFSTMTYRSSFEIMVLDIIETLCLIVMILFSKEILNTKKNIPIMDKFLYGLIIINVLDLFCIPFIGYSILYEYISRTLIILFLMMAGIITLYKGEKVAIFYILGWSVLFISLVVSEYNLINIHELFIFHIGFPIESMILSFALGYKLKQSIHENKEKEQLLVHQSKLASMGEMINNIAHQWRQPLTHLSFINMDIQTAQDSKELDKKYLDEKINESYEQIEFMSQTIDNFKDFYQPVKNKELFFISEAVNKAINIIKPSLDNLNINLSFTIHQDSEVEAFENEYSQVVLNFISNAKEVLHLRKIKNPKIDIYLEFTNNKSILTVKDNAKGISEDIINKIFNPYFSTKNNSSGIGLYMSKIIVESHFEGTISAYNTKEGACFKVEI